MKKEVLIYVHDRAAKLQKEYQKNNGKAAAQLARLRRGIGKEPEDDLDVFGLVFTEDYPGEEEIYLSRNGAPSHQEYCVYHALTLFAMHQQSKRTESMHERGPSLGAAAQKLAKTEGVSPEAVRKRFLALATSVTQDETTNHARGLIKQFRQHSITLDYARLAQDFFWLRASAATAQKTRTNWGRDFYYHFSKPEENKEKSVKQD